MLGVFKTVQVANHQGAGDVAYITVFAVGKVNVFLKFSEQGELGVVNVVHQLFVVLRWVEKQLTVYMVRAFFCKADDYFFQRVVAGLVV